MGRKTQPWGKKHQRLVRITSMKTNSNVVDSCFCFNGTWLSHPPTRKGFYNIAENQLLSQLFVEKNVLYQIAKMR